MTATRRSRRARGVALGVFFLAAVPSRSQAINIWTGAGGTAFNIWSNPGHWAAGAPITGDDLFFGPFNVRTSNVDDIVGLSINSITFTPEADSFELEVQSGFALSIAGPGVFNESPKTQNLNTLVNSTINLRNSAITTDLHLHNEGAQNLSGSPGTLVFLDNSSAGNSAINNGLDDPFDGNGDGPGGTTRFRGSSTAAVSSIFNEGGTSGGQGAGSLFFSESATAGSATLHNAGASISNAKAGLIEFGDSSMGGSATILNSAGANISGGQDHTTAGLVRFTGSANAQNVTIQNQVGPSGVHSAASSEFLSSASAGAATITNFGSAAASGLGGLTRFRISSTAGSAAIANSGASVNTGGGGSTVFQDDSTAGSAKIDNRAGTSLGAGGGFTSFADHSSAGAATIINHAGLLLSGGVAGTTSFDNFATAGSATITNQSGTGNLAFGGETNFNGFSSAGSATLIAQGGGSGGGGGAIFFHGFSSGGTPRVEVFGNGKLDISAHLHDSIVIGSLEGDGGGSVFLGVNNLTVGSNNLSTTFIGIIQDGGSGGGTGGSFTKIGTGTLVLGFGQPYTGPTAVNGGALIVNAGISTSAVTVNSGGTLGGRSGAFGSVDIQNGGTVSPGTSIGSFTLGSATFRPGGRYLFELRTDGTGSASNDWDLLAVLRTLDLSSLTPADPFIVALQTVDAANNPHALATWNPDVDHTWPLIVEDLQPGGIGGFDPALFAVDTSGFLNPIRGAFGVVQSGDSLALRYTAGVPEPSTLVLIAVAAGLGMTRRLKPAPQSLPTRANAKK